MITEQVQQTSVGDLKPNRRRAHVFAVLRIDEFHSVDLPLEDRVIVTKVMWDSEEAEQEVKRLNGSAPENVRYVARVTRID